MLPRFILRFEDCNSFTKSALTLFSSIKSLIASKNKSDCETFFSLAIFESLRAVVEVIYVVIAFIVFFVDL